MAKEEKKKGLFGKALDAVSSRDEKEALEKAEKAQKDSEAKAAQATIAANKAKSAVSDAEKRAAEAEAKAKKLEAEMAQKKADDRKKELQAMVKSAAAAKKKSKSIAEHTVSKDETLGYIAQKYYKHATKPYYMLIYEANKAVIGDDPNLIKVGMKLSIPELPDDMK